MSYRIAIVCALVLCCGVASSVSAQAPARGTGPIEITGPIRVIDGSTFEVVINGRRTGIGLIGIKAPAGNTACGRAAAALFQSLTNGRMRLEEDLKVTFDARKRRMYYLRLPSGVSAALEMARAGFASPDGDSDEADDLLTAVQSAISRSLGCIAATPR